MIRFLFQECLRLIYKPHSVQRLRACAVISLGGMSPCRSMQLTRDSNETSSLLSLLSLALGGGCLAIYITANAGGLLHHLFTITPYPCG